MSGDKIVLEVVHEYSREMIKSRYIHLIKNALIFLTGKEYDDYNIKLKKKTCNLG